MLLSFVCLSGCETLNLGGGSKGRGDPAGLETFAVRPVSGSYNQIMATYPERVEAITNGTIARALEKKGYRQVGLEDEPDFIVSSLWMISTQTNPMMRLAGGSWDTMQQIPTTIPVATVDVYANRRDDGVLLWRDSSPWAFDVQFATESDLENATERAMASFPECASRGR